MNKFNNLWQGTCNKIDRMTLTMYEQGVRQSSVIQCRSARAFSSERLLLLCGLHAWRTAAIHNVDTKANAQHAH